MNLPDISIIIPTKDRGGVFNGTLKAALAAVKEINAEIIVINDSKTAQPLILKNSIVRLNNNPKSGVASARNLGANLAKAEWLLFLDDDMLLFKENITSFLKYTNTNEKICVNIEWEYPPQLLIEIKKNAFGRFLIKYGFTTMRGWSNYPNWAKNSSASVNSIASPNLFINKKHFLATGGYDENFPFAGAEDHVFSERLKKNGFSMFVDTTSLMYHNEKDRINCSAWFKRKERGGETKKIAMKQGFSEFELQHNQIKKIFYFFNPVTEPFIKMILFFTSPFKIMDFISFVCYKILLGISTYKGYNKSI